jgi:ABC-type antimicrobial peptide transport system permease subunit
MIKNFLVITFRSLLKNKLFIFINIFGMGVAIACCIVAYLNWGFSDQWDSYFKNTEHVYRIQFEREFQGSRERYGIIPMPLAGYVKQNFKNVDKAVRYHTTYIDMRINDEVFGTWVAFADSGFFDLFSFEMRYGSTDDFFDKSKIFISDKTAERYFGRRDVVGEPLTQIILGADGVRRPKEFVVGGVFKKPPMNSSFRFDVITYFDNFWDVNIDPEVSENNWKHWTGALFVSIKDPTQVPQVTAQLQQYVEPQNKVREDFEITSYYLENFPGMMHHNRAQPRLDGDYLNGGIPNEAVTVPAIMASLLLILACFNFTNTSIAISSRRLKEIGIRKVMGGRRSQLVTQFLGENLLLCFFAFCVGLLLAEWLVPAYDSMWQWLDLNLSYTENAAFLLFLIALLMMTALVAGAYPSFYITSFEPVSILKGKAKFGGTNWFTRILLGGQFVISLLAIIMGFAFYQNGQYQANYDLGFDTKGVISVWVNNEGAFNTYRDAITGNTDIKAIAGTRNHIINSFYSDPVKWESLEREVDVMDVGDHYFEVMNLKLVTGRLFTKDSETDRKESIIVTEEFVKEFGWKDNPIGKKVVWMDTASFYVVGVVKNVYSRALWAPIEPTMFRYVAPEKYQQLVVSTEPSKLREVNKYLEVKWKELFPNTLYPGQMVDEQMAETNEINKNVTAMFAFLGFFAALMTGIGLYTLVSLNIVKKMKEIGVRKVLGASVGNISAVINYEFIINLGIATVVGGGLGYFGADVLMDSIWEYYLKLTFSGLGLSILLMLLIAFLSVGYKTVTTASLNPTKTLRDE